MSRMLGDTGQRDNSGRTPSIRSSGNSRQPIAGGRPGAWDGSPPRLHARTVGFRVRTPVHREQLPTAIEMAEAELRRLGLGHARVHPLEGVACLDLPSAEAAGIASEPLRGEVLRAVRAAGFPRVAVYIDSD